MKLRKLMSNGQPIVLDAERVIAINQYSRKLYKKGEDGRDDYKNPIEVPVCTVYLHGEADGGNDYDPGFTVDGDYQEVLRALDLPLSL